MGSLTTEVETTSIARRKKKTFEAKQHSFACCTPSSNVHLKTPETGAKQKVIRWKMVWWLKFLAKDALCEKRDAQRSN